MRSPKQEPDQGRVFVLVRLRGKIPGEQVDAIDSLREKELNRYLSKLRVNMSGAPERSIGSPVVTLKMTDAPTIVAAMCEDCACPKPNATAEGQANVDARGVVPLEAVGGAVIAAATFADEQMPLTFALTGRPEL